MTRDFSSQPSDAAFYASPLCAINDPKCVKMKRGMFCGSSGRCSNPDFGAPPTPQTAGLVGHTRVCSTLFCVMLSHRIAGIY
jgi:hypothetical protein